MPRSFLVKKNAERKGTAHRNQLEKVKRTGCTDRAVGESTRISNDKINSQPKNESVLQQHWNGFGTKCVYPAEVTSLSSVPSLPKSAVKFDRLRKIPDDRCKGVEELDCQAGNDQNSERERHQCHQCNKCYTTVLGLAKHQQYHCTSHHKKTFTCKHCDKIYVSLGALKMHIRTHTLPCKCKICGKAFSRPWLLQGHIRTHTGERPYVCSVCSRAFADRSNLRAHMQTHAEVKKYSCSRCARSFSRMSLLVKHEDSGCLSISQG